jgi:predicted Fe-Mo cluster-binding NifX family protein
MEELNMEKTRIAVVSKDGINVNDHFGLASRFLIYDCSDTINLVEERPTEPLSVGDPRHPFDPQKFGRILGLLKDCTKVYATKIGETPAARLRESGIEPVIYEGPIANITG